jgi:hypothetical protein
VKLVSRYFPGLVESVSRPLDQNVAEADHEKTPEKRKAGTCGLAIHLEPDREWTIEVTSPWYRVSGPSISLAELGAHAQIAMVSGGMGEACGLAYEIRERGKSLILRHLYTDEEDDGKELEMGLGIYTGFVVPAHPDPDQAVSFERTRRRVRDLVEAAIESGWKQAPRVCLVPPSNDWLERIPLEFADFLIVEEPAEGYVYPSGSIIAPVDRGAPPWWSTEDRYYYSLRGGRLWWDNWMVNPLTQNAQGS